MVREITSGEWSAIHNIYSALTNGELEQNAKSGRWSVIGGGGKSYSTGTLVRMTEKFLEAIPKYSNESQVNEAKEILKLLQEKGITESSDFSGTSHDLKLRISKIADFIVPSRAKNKLKEINNRIWDFENSLEGRLTELNNRWKELSEVIRKLKTETIYRTERTFVTGLPEYFAYDNIDKKKIVGFKVNGETIPLPDFEDKQKLKEFLADDQRFNVLQDHFKSIGQDLERRHPEGKALIEFSELLESCKAELDNPQQR